MAGISPISMITYGYGNINSQEQKLTAATESKLRALGVDTSGIRTESEGKAKLRLAEAERMTKGINAENSKKTTDEVDDNLQKARELADDLDISYNSDENVTELITKIQNKLNEMRVEAKDDFDKNGDIDYYQRQLDEIELGDLSQSNLMASMSMSANMNIAFHNLF